MTVNVQLQVSGDNISTYDIYQNTDDFSAPLATGVTVAELQSNYSITADNSASVIRFVPDSACGNYKDAFINFNDTTPSITLTKNQRLNSSNSPRTVSIASNNGGVMFAITQGNNYYTVNNGSSWQLDTSFSEDSSSGFIVCVNQNEFRVLKGTGQYFKWVNLGGWTATALSQNITGDILDFTMHNGIYYARTPNSIYRSENGSTFISVLDYTLRFFSIQKSIVGYGNTIYATDYINLYKSIDNGLNWTEIATANDYNKYFSSIYVESESNFVVSSVSTADDSTLSWSYSNDGGATLTASWLPNRPQATSSTASNVIIKIGDVYYFAGPSNVLSYTSDNIFTETAGSVSVIPNTTISDKDGGINATGRFDSISLIGSENRIVFAKPTIDGLNNPVYIYVGTITNT